MTMNSTTDTHRPTEAFRDFLEGEIVHTFRRGRSMRRLRAAAMILVSVAVGATATLASAQVRTSAQRDSLIEAARADALMASVSLELARAQLADAQRLVDAGARSSESLAEARLRVREVEARGALAALNIEEIQATSLPARDDLNAPVVNGKDFVKSRLQLQALVAQQRLEAAEQVRYANGRRIEVGAASDFDGLENRLAIIRARGDLAVLAERLRSRAEFLEKGTPLPDLMRRIERVEIQHEVQVAQHALSNANARLRFLNDRQRVGAATELDLLKAQVEVKELEIRMQQLSRRLQAIGKP